MRSIVKGIAVGVAAITLTACASASGSVPGPAGTPQMQSQWTSCDVDAPPPTISGANDVLMLPRLGSDFVPTAVIVCAAQVDQHADGGQELVATESRADDVKALVAALRLPDERPTTGACTLELPIVEWFALLDAQGRWIRAGVPVDDCQKPRVEVRNAMAGLHLTRVSTRVLRVITSPQAAAADCSQKNADMVSVETTQGSATSAAVRSDPFPAGARLRLCVYQVPPSELGTAKPAGDFERGLILSPETRAQIEKSLVGAPAAAKCSTEATRFALLSPEAGPGTAIYVELDKCRRIMVDAGTGPFLAQADAALIALLDQ